jgi:putative ABC transport system permease protein
VELREGVQAAAANFYISLEDAQLLGGVGPRIINQLFVRVVQASALDVIIQHLREALGEISAVTEQSIIQVMGGIARISDRFSGVASIIALIGGIILTGMALAASVTERRREIGLSKALGWTMALVTRYFLVEGLMVSLLGALVGLLLGWILTMVLGLVPLDFSFAAASAPSNLSFQPHDPVPMTLPAHVTFISIVVTLCTAIIGGALASWITARRAAALKPAEALRD